MALYKRVLIKISVCLIKSFEHNIFNLISNSSDIDCLIKIVTYIALRGIDVINNISYYITHICCFIVYCISSIYTFLKYPPASFTHLSIYFFRAFSNDYIRVLIYPCSNIIRKFHQISMSIKSA